jgi:YesN/AraC family two-component response regulator
MLWKISINLNGKITLEAIGNESGFRNRSTFIINFKGVTGENPSEYFKSNN